ncbi:MAG: hypothetical protein KDA24_08115 [Deltaproteobacteria bacterium]|nr:hypothetical protein [Deltaproteobacteria bacterium]
MSPSSFASLRLTLASVVVAALAGCGSNAGQLDLSAVGAAEFGEPYTAQLAVVRVQGDGSLTSYNDAASFVAGEGSMPVGLTMNEAGLIEGTPTSVGVFEQQVWVSNLKNIESFLDLVTIEVTAEGAFIGHERDQLTQITDLPGYRQSDIWLRPSGGGEEGMQTYTANVGIYLPGPNQVADGGGLDDVRIADLTVDEVTVTVGPWDEVGETDPRPGYPSGHYNEDSPVTHDGGFTFSAGSDTGEMDVSFSHPVLGIDATRVMVVPPDWCTNGFQEGSDWDNGVCE